MNIYMWIRSASDALYDYFFLYCTTFFFNSTIFWFLDLSDFLISRHGNIVTLA